MGTDNGTVGVATKKQPKGKAKVKASTVERKPMIAQLRGSEAFKAWIEEAAASDRLTVAGFLERAAVWYAKEIGFLKEAPER